MRPKAAIGLNWAKLSANDPKQTFLIWATQISKARYLPEKIFESLRFCLFPVRFYSSRR
jgi:hypothetical protein